MLLGIFDVFSPQQQLDRVHAVHHRVPRHLIFILDVIEQEQIHRRLRGCWSWLRVGPVASTAIVGAVVLTVGTVGSRGGARTSDAAGGARRGGAVGGADAIAKGTGAGAGAIAVCTGATVTGTYTGTGI